MTPPQIDTSIDTATDTALDTPFDPATDRATDTAADPGATASISGAGSAVDRFDATVDGWFDRIRGTEPADRILYALTELGDFGLIWVLLAFLRGLRSAEDERAAWRFAAALAAESVLINGIIKTRFKRERPVVQEPRPHRMRIPLTTSFPSGHSSTAMVAGILLSQRSSRPTKVALFGLGGLVAASRIHVRIHHASDVVGGVTVGLLLGTIARKVWPLYRDR